MEGLQPKTCKIWCPWKEHSRRAHSATRPAMDQLTDIDNIAADRFMPFRDILDMFYPIASLPGSQLVAEVSPTSTFKMAIVRSVESSLPDLMEERILAMFYQARRS